MNWLPAANHTTTGELGTLTTFIAQALNDVPTTISIQNLLAAYTMGSQATHTIRSYTNTTRMVYGKLDFTYDFRHLCRQQNAITNNHCTYEYFTKNAAYNHVHTIPDCSAAAKDAARAWITTEYGVIHDGGHVDAICDKIALQPSHNAVAVLVHTQRFLNDALFNQWADASALPVTAFLWVNFAFVTVE